MNKEKNVRFTQKIQSQKLTCLMAQEFDLDRDAVVEEVSVAPPPPPEAPAAAEEEDEETRRCREAKEWKEKGNAHYVLKSFEKALECYASALETCPGSSEPPAPPPDLADAEQGAESQAEVIENGAAEAPPTVEETAAAVGALSIAKQDGEAQVEGEAPPPADDRDPVAVAAAAAEAATNEKYAEQRAVLHCNAAACLQQLNRDEEAAGECSIALALSPRYVKCYMRRGQALEKLERWGEASKDMDAVLAMEPNSKLAKDRKARCDKLEAERLEKLKTETLGKLKDLGNSLLGNFGLSTDNFKFDQDPGTGSYNVQFVQNPT